MISVGSENTYSKPRSQLILRALEVFGASNVRFLHILRSGWCQLEKCWVKLACARDVKRPGCQAGWFCCSNCDFTTNNEDSSQMYCSLPIYATIWFAGVAGLVIYALVWWGNERQNIEPKREEVKTWRFGRRSCGNYLHNVVRSEGSIGSCSQSSCSGMAFSESWNGSGWENWFS